MVEIISNIDSFLWGTPMIVSIMFLGVFYTFGAKLFVFRHFGHILKNTLGNMASKESREKGKTGVSPFEAACVAVGGSVGVGNISGVASAIAVGGPGAVFWMWLWAFAGMTVKMVEVTMGCYYRSQNEKTGEYYGGPSYYMLKGLGEDKGYKTLGKLLSIGFGASFLCHSASGMSVFNISDGLESALGIPRLIVAAGFSLFLFYVTWKGVPRIAEFATKVVPVMCMVYLIGGLVLIGLNYEAVPGVLKAIFTEAFTGSAASGAFTGAAVSLIVRTGIARSINSNEAGQGASPMIHASADTIHPVRQGLWGATEVFVDTLIVCSVTALSILCTGVWNGGLTAAPLAISAFTSGFGTAGTIFVGIMIFMFGLTTSTGWFSYYTAIIAQGFGKNPKVYKCLMTALKIIYPGMAFGMVLMFVVAGLDANTYWMFIDVITVLPIFFNIVPLLILSDRFFMLLKDYKARYLGIGTVDPNMHVFYDDKFKK